MSALVHVAVGVIVDNQQRLLIARRPQHAHQGGLWEFPGGKVEAGESVQQALARELHEELGIQASGFRPLLEIRHDYGDKAVLLDVWWVEAFRGEACGQEGQPVRWVSAAELAGLAFPAANRAIIEAIEQAMLAV